MKNRRILALLIILLGLVILVLAIYMFFIQKPVPEPGDLGDGQEIGDGRLPDGSGGILPEPNISTSNKPSDESNYDISKEAPHQTNQEDVSKLASAFVERFGSYSNYSNYSNFSDIMIMMTSKMKTWAQNYVSELRASQPATESYYGITTKVIQSNVSSFDSNSAKVTLKTMRVEESANFDAQSYQQDIEISMVKQNNNWLVDSAFWLER